MRNLWLTVTAAAFAMALLFAALANGNHAAAQTPNTPTPAPTSEQPDGSGVQDLPPIEGKLNPPSYPNMDSNLNRIIEQVETGQFTAQAAAANAPIHREESVAVTLYITEGYAQDVWNWLEDNGASPRNIGVDYIEAYIPVSLLAEASQQEGVISIRTIIPAQPAQGTVVSDGVALHGAAAWHTAGLKGQGVKIGVIDSGFEGFASLMGTELPASVEARCYTDIGVFSSRLEDCENDEVHGTAVTEAAFDIAPEATYYIATPGGSHGDIVTAVDWMIDHGVMSSTCRCLPIGKVRATAQRRTATECREVWTKPWKTASSGSMRRATQHRTPGMEGSRIPMATGCTSSVELTIATTTLSMMMKVKYYWRGPRKE